MNKGLVFLICVMFSLPLRAETGIAPAPAAPSQAGQQPQQPPYPGYGYGYGYGPGGYPNPTGVPQPRGSTPIRVWDDRVFNVGEASSAPATTESPRSGTKRFIGLPANENWEVRERAKGICEDKRRVDMALYRQCFNEQMRLNQERIQARQLEVERGQSGPVRNVPRLPYDEATRNPAFEVDEESEYEY